MKKQDVRIKPSSSITKDMIRLNDSLFESQVKNGSLSEARRLDNIKLDVPNEANILTSLLMEARTMTVFTKPDLKELPAAWSKGAVSNASDRLTKILKNEGKTLHPNFFPELETIYQESLATDPSRQELQKTVKECIERNMQALPL